MTKQQQIDLERANVVLYARRATLGLATLDELRQALDAYDQSLISKARVEKIAPSGHLGEKKWK